MWNTRSIYGSGIPYGYSVIANIFCVTIKNNIIVVQY